MTLFSMRTGCALLLAMSLASCGGGSKATFPVAGTVVGLEYGPLILKTGTQTVNVNPTGHDTAGVANVVNYAFPTVLEYGDVYLVSVGTNPPHQSCVANQATQNSAGHTASINIAVGCTVNSFSVNGYVHGLTTEGLQLINGSTNGTLTITVAGVAAAAAAEAATPSVVTPSFTFPLVAYGQTYGVTVLTQPAGQTCTVTNGTAKMGDAAVYNISVDCVNNP